MLDFLTLLRENPYPGRGILVSRDLVYYFIMGRSANSRNRIFVKTEVNGKFVAKGEVVVIEESFGVRITEIIK